MVWKGLNEPCMEQGKEGETVAHTLNSFQYLICNAVLTSAKPQVQCYIGRQIHVHDIVHEYWRLGCLSQGEPVQPGLPASVAECKFDNLGVGANELWKWYKPFTETRQYLGLLIID